MVVRLPQAFREGGDLLQRGTLVHQAVEAVLARAAAAAHFLLHRAEPLGELAQPRAREPVASVQSVLQHPAISQLHQGISTVSPSYAGFTPSGSCDARSACPVSCVR